jgi:hypothetical protein
MSIKKKDSIYKYQRNLINYSFIAGIQEETLKTIKEKEIITPDILLCYPEDNINIYRELLDFVCPNGTQIYDENSPEGEITYHPIILTNQNGNRYFLYILKIIEVFNGMKIPIYIVLSSSIEDFDAFKGVLDEILRIIQIQKKFDLAKMELLNYLMFLHSIIIPPSHTHLTINFRYSKVNFYFHSLYEIPCHYSDDDINILFNTITTGKIIKLISQLVKDKQIIIYGDNSFLISSVINALNKLLFPFKWSNNLISIITKDKLMLLLSPGPQFYGVLSSSCSFDYLTSNFSGKYIYNLNNGKLIPSINYDLTDDDLNCLKKKIQFIKNPDLYKFNDMFNEKEKKNMKKYIDLNQSFSRNIQNIFFNFFRNPFDKYESFTALRAIDEQKFLREAEIYDRKKFFQFLLRSTLVDIFLGDVNDYNTDFNNSHCFDAILSNKKNISPEKININSALKIDLICPKINFNMIKSIISESNNDNIKNNESIKLYLNNINSEKDDFILNNMNLSHSLSFQTPLKKKSYPAMNLNSSKIKNQSINEKEEEIISLIDNNIQYIPNYKNYIKNYTPFPFNFYGKNGFIKFAESLFSVVPEPSEILFDSNFFNQIYEQISQITNSLPLISNEISEENDEISTSKRRNSVIKNHSDSNDNSQSQLLLFSNILEGGTQRHLFYAFYLEKLFLDKVDYLNNKNINLDNFLENIIALYHKSISYGEFEFPFYRYKLILSKLQMNSLNKFKNSVPQPLKSTFDDLYDSNFEKLRMTITKHSSLQSKKNTSITSSFNDTFIQSNRNLKRYKSDKIQNFTNNDLRKSEQLSDFNSISENIKNEMIFKSKKNKENQKINDFYVNEYKGYCIISNDNNKNNNLRKNNENFSFFICDINSPFTLNKVKIKIQAINPVKLLMEIGENLFQIFQKIQETEISFGEINSNDEIKNDFLLIKTKVEKLQIVNLAKLEKQKEKYSFWLNAFNFLTLYALMFTNYKPVTLDNWKLFLSNCRFNIGRYEITLLEIQNKVLVGTNFYGLEIPFTDNYIQRFCFNQQNILIDFGFYFCIKSNYFIIKIYSDSEFESQLYETTKEFFKKNLFYSEETQEMHISKYLAVVRPDFLDESYKNYQDYLDSNLYHILDEKKYINIKIENLNWELSEKPLDNFYN